MKKYIIIIILLISTLLLTLFLSNYKENNKEISKVERMLSKPEGIQAYTLNGQKTNKEFNDLINNYVLDKITCKNGSIATYNKATNEVSLSNIHMPDYCTMNFRYTIYGRLLADNPTISERTDFSTTFTTTNTGTLYKSTESIAGSTPKDVYYFAGDAKNNWVKFADFYWRIIRTNHDGSVRLLYSGTSPDTTSGYIGESAYGDPAYQIQGGYMYGDYGSIDKARGNTTDSTIKTYIDTWYSNNLLSYTKYLSKEAVYCNDREIMEGEYNNDSNQGPYYYAAYVRLVTNKTPTYDCTNNKDAFSGSNSEAKLKYPIALATVDELSYSGGVFGTNLSSPYVWYYTNSTGESVMGKTNWWTMSPYKWNGVSSRNWAVNGSGLPGYLSEYVVSHSDGRIRPVISLKGNLIWKSGDGSSTNPYEVEDLPPTLYEKLLADNPTIKTRTDFSTTYTETNTGTLFNSTESIAGNTPETVYYFSGNAKNNWVKFGTHAADYIKYRGRQSSSDLTYREYSTLNDCTNSSDYNYNCVPHKYASAGDPMYWRIIRTNHDSSIRLLYAGTSPDTEEGYIGTSAFNNTSNNPLYAGYMYGTSGTLALNRTNENNSVVKGVIDSWYSSNLSNYTKYISTEAVYCNDRNAPNYSTSTLFSYYVDTRLFTNNQPTYNCEDAKDAFSGSNSEAELTYSIGLMTADEITYAGGYRGNSLSTPYAWYYLNSAGVGSTGLYWWWTLSPRFWSNETLDFWLVTGSEYFGHLTSMGLGNFAVAVRPVISIKGDILYSSGNGSPENPYEIVYN